MNPAGRISELEKRIAVRRARRGPTPHELARQLAQMDRDMLGLPPLDDVTAELIYHDAPMPHVAAERLWALESDHGTAPQK